VKSDNASTAKPVDLYENLVIWSSPFDDLVVTNLENVFVGQRWSSHRCRPQKGRLLPKIWTNVSRNGPR
jgi:hypothetical protein